jgi:glutaredoxin
MVSNNKKKSIKKPAIKIYTMAKCPKCIELKKFLENYNLNYTEVNITGNKAACKTIQKNVGFIAAPVVKIGCEYKVGFSEEWFKIMLNL